MGFGVEVKSFTLFTMVVEVEVNFVHAIYDDLGGRGTFLYAIYDGVGGRGSFLFGICDGFGGRGPFLHVIYMVSDPVYELDPGYELDP